jgi:hypothetical protein
MTFLSYIGYVFKCGRDPIPCNTPLARATMSIEEHILFASGHVDENTSTSFSGPPHFVS